jgi:dynein heavy chain
MLETEKPLMQTDFVLQIPNIVIVPSLDELQNHFNRVMNSLFEVHKYVIMWGQQYEKKTGIDGK